MPFCQLAINRLVIKNRALWVLCINLFRIYSFALFVDFYASGGQP